MSEYTPSMEQVRDQYSEGDPFHVERLNGQFDRWLASERARIWDECSREIRKALRSMWPDYSVPVGVARRVSNPYREGGDA